MARHRRRTARARLGLVLALAAAGLAPTIASANPPPSGTIVISLTGNQVFHADADKKFYFDHVDLPPGISFAGSVSCTTLQGGVPITNSLPGGTYNIDPSSCSGVSLVGPGAENYTIQYAQGVVFRVYPAAALVVPTATSMTKSLLTGKMTYTAKVTHSTTGEPAVGQRIGFSFNTTVSGGKIQCTGVTNANGIATCTVGPVSITLAGIKFGAGLVPSSDYYGGYGTSKIGF